MKQSYSNENLHNELTLKIKEFIDSMEEFETTPFYQTEEGYQKSFGVLSDNGNFNVMKRFTITIEDHKLENKISEKKEMEVKQKGFSDDDVNLAFFLGKKDDHVRLHKLINSRLGQLKSE